MLALHGVEACLTQKGALEIQADKITSRLKLSLGLLRQAAANHIVYERVQKKLKDEQEMDHMESMVSKLRLENSPDTKHKLYTSAVKEIRSNSFPSIFDDYNEGRCKFSTDDKVHRAPSLASLGRSNSCYSLKSSLSSNCSTPRSFSKEPLPTNDDDQCKTVFSNATVHKLEVQSLRFCFSSTPKGKRQIDDYQISPPKHIIRSGLQLLPKKVRISYRSRLVTFLLWGMQLMPKKDRKCYRSRLLKRFLWSCQS